MKNLMNQDQVNFTLGMPDWLNEYSLTISQWMCSPYQQTK
jgi:hypothetical protein